MDILHSWLSLILLGMLVVGEVLTLKPQPDNCYDKFTVAVVKNDRSVGHMPNTVNKAVSSFLRRAGHGGFCEVRGNRVNHGVNLGVEVPCTYRFYAGQTYIDRLNSLLQ